jgi:hypothetical protein
MVGAESESAYSRTRCSLNPSKLMRIARRGGAWADTGKRGSAAIAPKRRNAAMETRFDWKVGMQEITATPDFFT